MNGRLLFEHVMKNRKQTPSVVSLLLVIFAIALARQDWGK